MSEELIPVFDCNNHYVCDVEVSYNLNDEEEECYIPGANAGLVRLQDGRYVFMLTSQYADDYNWGDIVTPAEALWLIRSCDHEELLKEEEFADLENKVRNTLLVPRPGQNLPRYLIH